VKSVAELGRMIANDYLDAAVTVFFVLSFVVVLADSARVWWAVISGTKAPRSTEVPFVRRAVVAGD
jgi:hypothetical protein